MSPQTQSMGDVTQLWGLIPLAANQLPAEIPRLAVDEVTEMKWPGRAGGSLIPKQLFGNLWVLTLPKHTPGIISTVCLQFLPDPVCQLRPILPFLSQRHFPAGLGWASLGQRPPFFWGSSQVTLKSH